MNPITPLGSQSAGWSRRKAKKTACLARIARWMKGLFLETGAVVEVLQTLIEPGDAVVLEGDRASIRGQGELRKGIHPVLLSLQVKTPCEVCGGKRFKDEVLAYKLNCKSISDVLATNVQQALEYFEISEVLGKLQAMSDVGLDYLSLGQMLSTLSGGECQRI